jgi:NAD(P)-dependent dehydrogenase (short-subunit alcohol dehydrogenase family)
MGLLDGKVAVITGAGRGIGRCHALAFAKEGAKVVVNDVGCDRSGNEEDSSVAEKLVEEIRAAGGEAVADQHSVATMEGGRAIIQTALDSFGKLDILVNNAGILRDKSLVKMTEEMWDAVITVHLKGTFGCTQPAAAHMKERGEGGRIINTSSLSGLVGNFGQSNYGAAKAGIAGFTRVAAIELMKYGITVNAIVPTALTRMTDDLPIYEHITERELGPQWTSPIAVFLASDLAKNITGKFIANEAGKIFELKMIITDGVTKDTIWTPTEIAEKIDQILSQEAG